MYKLFVTRITKRISSSNSVLYMPKQIIVHRSMHFCSFCNFYHWKTLKFTTHHQIRTHATTLNRLDEFPPKKKGKQRIRKYTEILEVTDKTTSDKKAAVQKLNVADISKLVNQPDMAMDVSQVIGDHAFHKVSHLNHCCQNDSDISSGDDMNTYNVEMQHANESFKDERMFEGFKEVETSDSDACHDKVHFNDTLDKETKLPEVKVLKKPLKEPKKNKASQEKETNVMASQGEGPCNVNNYIPQVNVDRLLTHMQMYLNCGMIGRAKKLLFNYMKSMQHKVEDSRNHIEFYNLLLQAYASRGNFFEAEHLYDEIKNNSLTPTPQTYLYILDALGRVKNYNNRKAYLGKLHYEMNSYNISFNDVFSKSYFMSGQQENVLKMVKLIMPTFKPSYSTIDQINACKLLDNIPMESNYENPLDKDFTIGKLRECLRQQIQNEFTLEIEIKSIMKHEAEDAEANKSKLKIVELENYWREAALAAFERNLKCLREKEIHSPALTILHPFLEILDKKSYVDAIMREIKSIAVGSEMYSVSLRSLYVTLGRYIYKKYEVATKQRTGELDKIISIYEKYLEWYLNPKNNKKYNNMNNRNVWECIEEEQKKRGIFLNNKLCLQWPLDVIINIGKFLYNIILNDIILQPGNVKGHDFKSSSPVFYTLFRNKGQYLTEQIKPHPVISKLYKESALKTISFDSIHVPSCIPPRPWTSINTGGYIIAKTDFVRSPIYSDAPTRKLKDTPREQLFPIFDSVNQLGSTPWTINSPILDIVIEIFQKGGSEELNVPQSISMLPLPTPAKSEATLAEKQKTAGEMMKYRQKKSETYALWCDALYRLSLADHFRNKIFWLPHNLDFRGRVYPLPPHLNHLSSDLGRSLLLFAKAKPLGPKGLDWLKLHVINLTSLKKQASIKERLEYANENIENILDSAAKPLTGNMWWTKSEEPWQTLAGCMEIANALKSPNVEEYESRYPIHQDGSCNGLQHYAALGRDQVGAESVNLYPFDTPNDVYTAVANMVEKRRQADAKNNVDIAQVLEGYIKRKVIKQTVMTTVYGVTRFGAKLQIMKQLQDIPDFPQEHIWCASQYLTENTFRSLRTMFTSARKIQDWFASCARLISVDFDDLVEWVTPLGFPIVQPYIKHKYLKKGSKNPDSMKQKNAFAPNFIHSLDSTHMMLTCLHCKTAGITFVSVHDCFWTHACTVDIMNRICREQFIALHSEPILDDLATFFIQRYAPVSIETKDKNSTMKHKDKCFMTVPHKGTFDINHVLRSTYFFS